MKNEYHPLFRTYTFANQAVLKNRFVLAPLTHSSSNEDGTISTEEIPYIADLSKDVGLAITAATYVSDNGKAFPRQASIAHDRYIPGLQRQAKAMKQQGAKAMMQLHHGGNMAPSELVTEGDIVAPSMIAKDGKEQPRALTTTEIDQIIQDFGEATRRAIEAGFDGVEIHGANHYLLQQFSSPYFNDRTDQWGERSAFPLAIVDVVTNVVQEHALSDFLVGYRFSPEEPEDGGITMKETVELIDNLVHKPLDYLHVSLMDLQSTVREGENPNKKRIDVIQQRVNQRKPIIGIGSIYTAEDAVQAEQTGVSLIGLGRELLMDSDFIVKLQEGREEDIVHYIDPERTDRHGIPKPLWDLILQADWFPIKGKNEKGTTFLA